MAKLKEADQKWCCQSYTPYKDICVDGTTTLERFESSNALRTLMPSDGDFFGVYDGTKRTMEGANKADPTMTLMLLILKYVVFCKRGG